MTQKKPNILFVLLLLVVMHFNVYGQTKGTVKSIQAKNEKKVVFIAGTDSHGKGEHEHNGGSTILAARLKQSIPEIDTVVYHNGWPKDISVLRDADAIVLYCDGGGDHIAIPHLKELDTLAKKGVGFVMIHFTLEVPKETAGDYFKNWIGGYFEINWSVNPVWTATFTNFPNHPITNGVKPFTLKDEWYYHMRFADDTKNITPILKTLPPDSTLNREIGTHSNNQYVKEDVLVKKQPQTMAWAYNRPGGGRGFGFTGGHVHANWKNDNFRMLVLNAIAWTANVKIPKNGIQSETPTQNEIDSSSKHVN